MREYESIQKWFADDRYTKHTENTYLGYITMFCCIVHKNPDELADVTSEEALNLQKKLVNVMREEFDLRIISIIQRIAPLHMFWRINGVEVTDDMMKYKGTPRLRTRKGTMLEKP